jgi:hypothetical protein
MTNWVDLKSLTWSPYNEAPPQSPSATAPTTSSLIPLKDEVVIAKVTGLDDYGQPIFGVSTTYKCRIDEGTKLTRNQQGSEVISAAQILLSGGVAVGYNDVLIFVDAGGEQRAANPIRISTVKDISSKPLFTKVEL